MYNRKYLLLCCHTRDIKKTIYSSVNCKQFYIHLVAVMEFNNRMQKYRSKLKENPEKLKEHLERERERDRKRRNLKKATMDEKALEEKRKKDRERQRKHRENRIKNLKLGKVSAQISASNLFEVLL